MSDLLLIGTKCLSHEPSLGRMGTVSDPHLSLQTNVCGGAEWIENTWLAKMGQDIISAIP